MSFYPSVCRWVIRHSAGDYKTGRSYGERPPLVIAPHVYPELEAFMSTWRSALAPTHNLLFTRSTACPLADVVIEPNTVFRLYDTRVPVPGRMGGRWRTSTCTSCSGRPPTESRASRPTRTSSATAS